MSSKKTVLAIAVLAILAFGSLSAVAAPFVPVVHDFGNYVDLGNPTQNIVLTGTGSTSSVDLDLGSCSHGTCTYSGLAYGYGTFDNPARAPFAITSSANITLKLINPTTELWQAATNANSITFSYGTGGSLLHGYINQLEYQEVSPGASGGQDRYLGTANVTITGGSEDQTPGMQMQLLITNSPNYFNALLGPNNAGKTITISSRNAGESPVYPTPEPATLALLGAGFLLASGVVRFRQRRSVVLEQR